MKFAKKLVVLLTMMSLLSHVTAYANDWDWNTVAGHHGTSSLLTDGELSAQDVIYSYARGDILSTAILDISNCQNGDLYISIETYAHREVDVIYQTVFIDQWDEDEEDWNQIGYWDFSKTKEEANGSLTHWVQSFTITGYEVNRYYRARGLHGVEYNDEIEACATETNGVLLTDWQN